MTDNPQCQHICLSTGKRCWYKGTHSLGGKVRCYRHHLKAIKKKGQKK